MHRHSGGVHVCPEAAFVAEHGFEAGGLADDGEVVAAMMLRKVLRTKLCALFRHEADEVDFDGESGDFVAHFVEGPEHGGHGPFGV